MTEPITWMVIAPRREAELALIAQAHHAKEFPYGTHPWTVARGHGYAALISRMPGSEGADWTLAEIISNVVGDKPVYSLWFDPERSAIVEWRSGQRIGERPESPEDFAQSLGFTVELPAVALPSRPPFHDVLVIDGASVEEVQDALADLTEDDLRVEAGPAGAIVSSEQGRVPSVNWRLSAALPNATVYHVEHQLEPDQFGVLVLKDGEETGSFYDPPAESERPMPDILGARTREDVLARLGVAPSLLDY